MAKIWKAHCTKGWNIDIKFNDEGLKFTRDFEDSGWNGCAEHSQIDKDFTVIGDCMTCEHFHAEPEE